MGLIYKDELTTVSQLTDITCDFCNSSCKTPISTNAYTVNYAKIVTCFGYGSIFDDGHDDEIPMFYLCEQCYKNIILTKVKQTLTKQKE